MTPAELAALAQHAPGLQSIKLTGAFQLSRLDPLTSCAALKHLTLDHTTVTDAALIALLPALNSLQLLSLRGCGFLKGDFLPSLTACAQLSRLDLADCALALHLNLAAGKALAALTCLEVLDLAGCGASDGTLAYVAELPRLRALGLRDAHTLSEIGLEALAAGPAGRILGTLDLEGCSGLGEGCWPALARLQALKDLSLARMPQLLQQAPMAEQHAAALWRWPSLQRLSLAGSAVHPAKLKLLAATCGAHLTELDLSMPSADAAPSMGSLRSYLSRLPLTQLKDLGDSARALRNLKKLRAAWSGLPLEAAVAFMRSAVRLEELDLSGCSLSPGGGGVRQRHAPGQWWTSGVFMSGTIEQHRFAKDGVSKRQVGSGPVEFGAALGVLTALRRLSLAECGLLADHVRFLGSLQKVENLCVASNRGLGDEVIDALAASSGSLVVLDVSGTSVTEEGLCRLASRHLPRLQTMRAARCTAGVTSKSIQAWANAECLVNLRELDVSDCSAVGDAAVCAVAASLQRLQTLKMSGCMAVTETGVTALANLRALRDLDLARCGKALTDEVLASLCQSLPHLTRLSLGSAHRLTKEVLPVLGALGNLAELDLTCCTGLGDDDSVPEHLPRSMVAVIDLPQGAKGPSGSPLKRRPRAFRFGQQLAVH